MAQPPGRHDCRDIYLLHLEGDGVVIVTSVNLLSNAAVGAVGANHNVHLQAPRETAIDMPYSQDGTQHCSITGQQPRGVPGARKMQSLVKPLGLMCRFSYQACWQCATPTSWLVFLLAVSFPEKLLVEYTPQQLHGIGCQ